MYRGIVLLRCLAVVVGSLVLAGCGAEEGLPVYPVSGQVFVQGKPAEGALVIFYPIDPQTHDAEKFPPRPSGLVEADGTFQLTTSEPKDGARVGEYDVTIVWFKNASTEESAFAGGGESRRPSRDALKGKYAQPKTSGLKASIANQPNELPPFNLD